MQRSEHIKKRLPMIAADCQAACKTLAVLDPFISTEPFEKALFDADTPEIVSVIVDKMSRYSTVCIMRVWEEKKSGVSLKEIFKLLRAEGESENNPFFEEIYENYCQLKNSSFIEKLRKYRHNFGAHTSGETQDDSSSFSMLELVRFNCDTCELIDKLYTYVFGESSNLSLSYESWCGVAKYDWAALLGREELLDNP